MEKGRKASVAWRLILIAQRSNAQQLFCWRIILFAPGASVFFVSFSHLPRCSRALHPSSFGP